MEKKKELEKLYRNFVKTENDVWLFKDLLQRLDYGDGKEVELHHIQSMLNTIEERMKGNRWANPFAEHIYKVFVSTFEYYQKHCEAHLNDIHENIATLVNAEEEPEDESQEDDDCTEPDFDFTPTMY